MPGNSRGHSQTSSSIPSNSPPAITNTPAPAQRGFLDPFQQPANAAQFQNAQGFSVNGGQFTSSSTRGGDVVNHVTIHGQLNFVSCSPVEDTRTTSMTPSIPKDYGYSERRMHPGRDPRSEQGQTSQARPYNQVVPLQPPHKDLEESIRCLREALELCLAPHPDRSGLLNDLANLLSKRFEQKGDFEDREESIRCLREALGLCPAPHPNRSGMLSNLANLLSKRFKQKGDFEDREESIRFHREAWELRPAPHPVQYIGTTSPTDNERNSSYLGCGNGSSAPYPPARNTFHLPAPSPRAPEPISGSSNSPNGGISSPSFVFPGSRSVAHPKSPLKINLRSKSRRRKDSTGTSPISEFLHGMPPALSCARQPNPSTTALPSPGSTNPMNVLPGCPDTMYSEASVLSNESGIVRARNVSGPSGNTSPVYVVPTGGSRAKPKLAQSGSKSPRSGKFPGNARSGEGGDKRTGFMSKLLKKKTKGAMQATIESREEAKGTKSRIGSYPLDPYDSVLLDNDRHTEELLVRVNPTSSPSFHNYGNNPPTSVLDLGCGQGYWVVDAAIAWKEYGTKVTGYDMVEVSRGLLPWAAEQGVIDNIRFVRGNFLKQRLPFSNESFDLVRMSRLALCITSGSWILVLQEVARVLVVGGRLELIDDVIFFPYGKSSTSLDIPDPAFNSQIRSVAPRLDINIPSAAFSRLSIYDSETNNPGLGLPVDNEETEDFYDLYGVEEEDADDTATLNGRGDVHALADPSDNPRALPRTHRGNSSNSSIDARSWTRACATSGDLEALFEHMLLHKFGINKNPSEFVLGLMKEVFGHAREIKTMHLTLAPPEPMYPPPVSTGIGKFARTLCRGSMGLLQAPGLVLWPSTFIPMDQTEIEIHASKHLRMLLSCKSFLLEHAIEATEDDEIDEESVLEALWEYECFLRPRFNPPPLSGSSSDDDTLNIRGSIAESVSSEGLDAMWEMVSEPESRKRFIWQGSLPETPQTPKLDDNTQTAPIFPSSPSAPTNPNPTNPLRDTDTSNAAPVYPRDELTHVRTFRIYEAIKFEQTILGPSARGPSGISAPPP